MSIDLSDPLVHPFYKQVINDLAFNFGTTVRSEKVVRLRMARLLENHYGIRSEAAFISYLGSPAAAEERKRIEVIESLRGLVGPQGTAGNPGECSCDKIARTQSYGTDRLANHLTEGELDPFLNYPINIVEGDDGVLRPEIPNA